MLRRCIYSRPEHSSATYLFSLFLETYGRPVCSFAKLMIHNINRLEWVYRQGAHQAEEKVSIITGCWLECSFGKPDILSQHAYYIYLHFPDLYHFSVPNRYFFSHLTQPCCSLHSGKLEITCFLPTQNISCQLKLVFLA